jgi:transcriptional regulator with PAS, ATPase and Fis domain
MVRPVAQPSLNTAEETSGDILYFHLLSEQELRTLRPLLAALGQAREQVLRDWYQLYQVHLSGARFLSEAEFLSFYGPDLDATSSALAAGDFDRFVSEIRRVGNKLADRGVPFAEVVASIHFFEQAAGRVFRAAGAMDAQTVMTFDKVSHCRMIVLGEAYLRSCRATAAARIRDLEREAAALGTSGRTRFHGLVGGSATMRQLYERIEAAAATRGTVLVVGESGTGKELVARALHECSASPQAPFVALNCAAVPRELIESELFGYKRGAFSGAVAEYLGLFRAAQGGTLFLDEVTEMSAETQSKLLRALQERTVRPVGSTSEVAVNVRLIASTNRDPEAAVAEGRLRRDLYYRLQVNVLKIPPLHERLEDVPLLAEHFVTLFNEKLHPAVPVVAIDPEALSALQRYHWPGNVRELSNAIEAAFTFGRSDTIRLVHLPPAISRSGGERSPSFLAPGDLPTFADAERELIRRALLATYGNKVRAAKRLRISRKKLYAKIAKYDLGSL